MIIKEIIKKKDLDISQVAKQLGIARNTVYQVFGRSRLSDEDLMSWSKVLGVAISDITDRQNIESSVMSHEKLPDDYLMKYVAELEARIKEQSQQLDMQNETIRVLLGKSKASGLRLSRGLVGSKAPIFLRIPV